MQPLLIFGLWPDFGKIFHNLMKDAADLVLSSIAQDIFHVVSTIVTAIYAGYLRIPTPGVGGSNPLDNTGKFISVASFTNGHLLWLSGAVATVSIAIAGGKMLWSYTHGYHSNLRSILSGLTIMVIVNLLVIQAVRVALWIGDKYTSWILDKSTFNHSTDAASAALSEAGNALLLCLVGGLVMLSVIVQLILMVFRSAVLVLLAGTIVLPAAASTTDTGRKWLNKYIAWMLAFICMKPAAATVYAVAFQLINSDSHAGSAVDKIEAAIAGMVLLGAAVFVLPALLRLLTPVGVALAGSALNAGDGGGSSGSGQQPSGSSEPASQGMDNNSSGQSSGQGGTTSGPTGATSAEQATSSTTSSTTSATTSATTSTATTSGAATSAGGLEAAGMTAAPETGGASLAVAAVAAGAQEVGRQVEGELQSTEGSGGPVGGVGGGVDP